MRVVRRVEVGDDIGIGRGDRLRADGRIEDEGVEAGTAGERVDVVAAIDPVIAIARVERIPPRFTKDLVVVVAAEQGVVATLAKECVVAVEAVEPVEAIVAGEDVGDAIAAAVYCRSCQASRSTLSTRL